MGLSPKLNTYYGAKQVFFSYGSCFSRDSLSLYDTGCLGTHSVDKANLEFTEIHLLMPPECWD